MFGNRAPSQLRVFLYIAKNNNTKIIITQNKKTNKKKQNKQKSEILLSI